MDNYTIFQMFENPRRGRQARNFTTNAPKTVDLKSSSEEIFFPKTDAGCPEQRKIVWKRVHDTELLSLFDRNFSCLTFKLSTACSTLNTSVVIR